jgi:ribonuclease E
VHTIEAAKALMALQSDTITSAPEEEEEADIGQEDEAEVEEQAEADTEQTMAPDTPRADDSHEDGTPRRKRRRRRRHGGGEGQENREPGSHPATATPDAAFEGQPHDQPSNDAEHGYESENTATEAGAMPAGENGHPRPDGEPRRRRRGRRGGRRNRRDREGGPPNGESRPEESHGEQSFRSTPDIAESTHVPRIEPSAVGMETNYQPAADSFSQAAAPPTPQPEAEPPRRRSTIREPAPTFPRDEAPALRAEPAPPVSNAPEPQNEEAGKPRKTGWWAKRLLGGNS